MPTIVQPTIAFVNATTQNEVDVTFGVKFTGPEVGLNVLKPWQNRYPNLFKPKPVAFFSYSVSVILQVVRMVPIPIVGGVPPPLPAPVDLYYNTFSIAQPPGPATLSLTTRFSYQLAGNSGLITDHLMADIRLYGSIRIGSIVRSRLIDSKRSFDIVLTAADLANPQNGIQIP